MKGVLTQMVARDRGDVLDCWYFVLLVAGCGYRSTTLIVIPINVREVLRQG